MHGIDFIYNRGGSVAAAGGNAARLLRSKFNPAMLRPWYDPASGGSYYSLATGKKDDKGRPLFKHIRANQDGLLTMREWIQWDSAVQEVRRNRLAFWNALAGIGTYTIPNGLRKTVLQYPTRGTGGNATMSMDGRRRAENFRTTGDIGGLPLPLIHADWDMSLRELEVTRDGDNPLDETNLREATTEAMTLLEKLAIGLLDTYSFGGYTVYGALNLPTKMAYTFTDPSTAGWTPQVFMDEMNAALALLRASHYYGTNGYAWFVSPAMEQYLDMDYNENYSGETLRTRAAKIPKLGAPVTLDYLTGFRMIIIERDPNTARAVSGMDWTPIQWSTEGGMDLHFKLWAIKVPQFRSNAEGTTSGVLDAAFA